MTDEVTEMPRCCSRRIQSEVAWRAALRPFTVPASWMAPPKSSSFSVSVVLPASGCEMIAKVRRRLACCTCADSDIRAPRKGGDYTGQRKAGGHLIAMPAALQYRPAGHHHPLQELPVTSRREFTLALTGTAFAGLMSACASVPVSTDPSRRPRAYGSLVPDPMRLLDLPQGFRYHIISSFGDRMDDGFLVGDNA